MTDKVEKMFDNFDNNIKLAKFYIEMETFFNLKETQKTINKINNLLAESSRIVKNY
jgi:hypothetical protein